MDRALQEGDKAPAFRAVDDNGQPQSLADYKGKRLVLYFYPADDTPACTVQACNLRDNFGSLKKAGITILGISPDDTASHRKFREKFDLPFPLLADPEHKIIDKYGVWGPKKLYGREYTGLHRTTFLVDEKGIIRKIFLRPRNKQHAEEIMEAWSVLDK